MTQQKAPAFDSYARPAVAVDPVVLEVSDATLRVAIRRRDAEPQIGTFALPGVFVQLGETLDEAVRRGVAQKCLVDDLAYVEQLFTSDAGGRDPRGWVIAVAYFVVVPPGTLEVAASQDADVWMGDLVAERSGERAGSARVRVGDAFVPLAFDHEQTLGSTVSRLRGRLRYSPVALEFLPETFTLRELQVVYEAILGTPVNKDSFRRHVVVTMKFVEPTGEVEQGVSHRPAELYRRSRTSGLAMVTRD